MPRFFLYLYDRPMLAWLLVAAVSVPAAIGITHLRFDDDYLNLIRSDESEFVALERAHEDFASEVHDLLIVIDSDDLMRIPTLRALERLVDALSENQHFGGVLSIFDATHPLLHGSGRGKVIPRPISDDANLEAVRRDLLAHPVIAGQLLDKHGRTTIVTTSIHPHTDGRLPIGALDLRLAEVNALIDQSELRNHARVRLTGPPAIRSVTVSSLARDQIFFGTTAFCLAILVGWLLFRAPGVVAGTVTPPLIGVFWTLGYMGLIGESINLINGTVAPLLLAITMTDTVHLVSENRVQRQKGLGVDAAARKTLATLASPCTLTSLTTAIGFGSLILADIELVRRFGAACAAGMLFCLLSVLVLVPLWSRSLLSKGLDDKIRTPSSPRPPRGLAAAWRQPTPMVAASVAIFLVLLAIAVNLRTDVRATTELPRSSEAYEAFRHLEDVFGGMLTAHVIVRWPENQSVASRDLRQVISEVHAVIEQVDNAGPPFSLLNVEAALRGRSSGLTGRGASFGFAPKAMLRRLVEPKTRSAVVYVRMRDDGARALLPVLDGLKLRLAGIEKLHPGYVIQQTGLLPVHVRTIDRLVSTLARSLVFAIPVIFLTLAFAFGSVRLALASVIPNALPLVSIAVYLVAAGWHVGIAGALSFTVALGIAVDDTIHFIDRYRRSCATESTADAIESAWSSLAGVMLVTTAILIAGFGTLAWSEFTGVRYFGGLSCLALVVAAAGDLVVLPAWLARFVPASRLR